MNVAVLAFPLYILLMLLELAYERHSGRSTYRLADAATSINTAVLRVLLEGPLRLLLVLPYAWLYEHGRLLELDADKARFLRHVAHELKTPLAALREGVALLQYRHKHAGAELRMEQSVALLALCRRYRVPFVVNDHVDLCLLVGADGVHLGGTDARIAETRARLGPDAIIGASCYGEMQLALDAQDAGASYVAFGGFYPSRVKQYAVTTQPAILDQARRRIELPRVVIGGMTPRNAAPLVARG
eukprot:gene8673-10688_t